MHFEWPPVAPPRHVPADRIVDFDIYNPPRAADLHSAWKTLQRPETPDVVWTPRNGGHWIVTRGSMIADAYRDHESFASRIVLVPKEVGEQYHFVPNTVDPPEHRPYRGLLSQGLSPRAIKRIEPMVERLASDLVDDLAPRGHCNFTTDFAEILPIHIFMRMCDLPAEDGRRVKYWADQFTRPDGSMTIAEATEKLYAYLSGPVDSRRLAPGDDFLSGLVTGAVDGTMLTRDQALAVSAQVLLGGLDTVVNFLNFVLLFLARDPDSRRALVTDPGLVPAACDEFLRRFPLATSARVVAADKQYGGVLLKEGDMIVIPSALHGLDERENPDPMTVDFHRKNIRHSTFGAGVHRCPGSYLARVEVAIAVTAWLKRIPDFAVEPGFEVKWRGGVVGSIEALPLCWEIPA